MKTLLLDATVPADVKKTVELLQAGELVAVPTETVYGLAADATNCAAVEKIFIAKNRPATHPLIVHIASVDALSVWAKNIPAVAYTLAQAFWPGPLTLLLEKADHVNNTVTGGHATIAVRVPQHLVLLHILETLGTGLAAPSANPHKKISPTTAQHVMKGLSGTIAAVLDGGPCTVGVESTIVDLTGPLPKILRPGPITQTMLETVLGYSLETAQSCTKAVPGNMHMHYQPHTPSFLLTQQEITLYLANPENSSKKIGILHYSHHNFQKAVAIKLASNATDYAAHLYRSLHELDSLHLDVILIEQPPVDADWSAVNDRLTKATAR